MPRRRLPGAIQRPEAHPVQEQQAHLPPPAVPRRRRQDADVRQHQPRGAQRGGEHVLAQVCVAGERRRARAGRRQAQHRVRHW